MSQRLLPLVALVSLLAGCAANPTADTRPAVDGRFDDISNLECRGRVLDKVSECHLQEARVQLGAPESLTMECREVLWRWRRGEYERHCGNLAPP